MKPKIHINNVSVQEAIEIKLRKRELKNRILSHTGCIRTSDAAFLIAALKEMAMESDEPIHLYLYNTNCSTDSGLALFDTIRMLSCEVFTAGYGILDSVSSLIIAAGSKGKRYLSPNTECVLSSPDDGPTLLMSSYRFCHENKTRHMEKIANMLALCTRKTADEIQFQMEHEQVLSSTDALHYGIIDHIGDPVFTPVGKEDKSIDEIHSERNIGSLSSCFGTHGKTMRGGSRRDVFQAMAKELLNPSERNDTGEPSI